MVLGGVCFKVISLILFNSFVHNINVLTASKSEISEIRARFQVIEFGGKIPQGDSHISDSDGDTVSDKELCDGRLCYK